MPSFELLGALPQSTTMLEASAGTGKTYAIAVLTARYLLEAQHCPDELLLITFNNHAAAHLRERVRARLGTLREYLGGQLPEPPDEVTAHLANLPGVAQRVDEVLDRFSDLTISTTHSFCQEMLRELGILGDWDPAESVGPENQVLAMQCASDVYLAHYANDPAPAITPEEALQRGRDAALSTLPLLPDQGPWYDYASRVRREYQQRKRNVSLRTFEDLVTRLRDALEDPSVGQLVRDRLRSRFQVVLVDEFQDTDPAQWQVIERAFVDESRPTILIGDPKQSIYGFRGADLGVWAEARARARVWALDCNFRSDQAVVAGIEALFAGASLGDGGISVTPQRAQHRLSRLQVPGSARVWIQRCPADELPGQGSDQAITASVVSQAKLLLANGTYPQELGPDLDVKPSDIAVLVRFSDRAKEICTALNDAGLPAVVTGSQSVWRSPAAGHWRALLKAIAEPTQATIRLAALTPLLGSRLSRLLDASSGEPARVATLVRTLAEALQQGGIGRVLTILRVEGHLAERLLTEPDGERMLADLGHLAELLDASQSRSPHRLLALLEEGRAGEDDADALRLATDHDAIRVMTIHASKGLEFPIVFVAESEGFSPSGRKRPFSVGSGASRRLYIGPPLSGRDELAQQRTREELAEGLRLLYVAMTRAQNLVLAWHVGRSQKKSVTSPLAHLLGLHGSRPNPRQQRPLSLPTDLVYDADLRNSYPNLTWSPPPLADTSALALGTLERAIDQSWRRTSYSGLTAALHEAPAEVISDESLEVELDGVAPSAPELAASSPMAMLPAGASFGTLVHEVLELTDWAPESLEASAAHLVAELGPAAGLGAEDCRDLAQALTLVCRTRLLPLTSSTLSEIPIAGRLPELDFDLPLADAGAPATLAQLAELMAELLSPDDPLADYPSRLASSAAGGAVLNGFLTGSIDAVLSLPGGSFGVVDYKTNRLAPHGQELTLGHYTQAAMAEAMMQAHYPLQAMLYCVALHRFLGNTLPGYDPFRHLGGVGYLFVRGMAGPDTPTVDGSSCGVFGWFPPPALTIAASKLLGGHHG